MTSSFVSPLDCLTSFLGISLSRAVSSFGLPVYSSIHSRRITKCPKIGHYGRVVFPKLAEAAGNARGVPNALPSSRPPPPSENPAYAPGRGGLRGGGGHSRNKGCWGGGGTAGIRGGRGGHSRNKGGGGRHSWNKGWSE